MAPEQAPAAPAVPEGGTAAPRRRPKRRRPDGTRISLSDEERAEVYAARTVLLGPKGGLRELLLGLIRGEAHELADRRRIADLAAALATARSVTADVRDLTAAVRGLEQRIARLAIDAPAASREHAGELRDALFAAEHTLANIDRALAGMEKGASPAFEAVSAAVRGILAAHDAALTKAMNAG